MIFFGTKKVNLKNSPEQKLLREIEQYLVHVIINTCIKYNIYNNNTIH